MKHEHVTQNVRTPFARPNAHTTRHTQNAYKYSFFRSFARIIDTHIKWFLYLSVAQLILFCYAFLNLKTIFLSLTIVLSERVSSERETHEIQNYSDQFLRKKLSTIWAGFQCVDTLFLYPS